ncbi:MAG TPA: hypothetical protein V6D50_21665 [Chroococcales cyanobacterium]
MLIGAVRQNAPTAYSSNQLTNVTGNSGNSVVLLYLVLDKGSIAQLVVDRKSHRYRYCNLFLAPSVVGC